MIFFSIDWFDLHAVQRTLKSLLQHHSLKASILQCSAFFKVQLSLPYITVGKTIALTRQTFVGKRCLCFLIGCLGLSSWRRDRLPASVFLGFPHGSVGKESACNEGDLGSISGLGRSPRRGHGNPLQYSCLENFYGQRCLVGCSLWGREESDMTEALSRAQHRFVIALLPRSRRDL